MAMDKMQIEIQKAIFGSAFKDGVFLRDFQNNTSNDVEDALNEFKRIMDNVSGLVHEGGFANSTDTSALDHMTFTSREAKYGTEYFLTSTESQQLRNAILSELVSSTITSYKDVFVRCTRNNQTPSDLYPGNAASNDGLEIFIFDIIWKNQSYLNPSGTDSIDDFLAEMNSNLDTISGLEYAGLVGSSSRGATTQLFIGLDDVTYNGNKYLTPSQVASLRIAIKDTLDSITNVNSYGDVTVAVSRKDGQNSDDY